MLAEADATGLRVPTPQDKAIAQAKAEQSNRGWRERAINNVGWLVYQAHGGSTQKDLQRVAGGMRVVGGVLAVTGGIALVKMTGGVGYFLGGGYLIGRGLDNIRTGGLELWDGEAHKTLPQLAGEGLAAWGGANPAAAAQVGARAEDVASILEIWGLWRVAVVKAAQAKAATHAASEARLEKHVAHVRKHAKPQARIPKEVPRQEHHAIPHNNTKFQHEKHKLVDAAGVRDLKNLVPNKKGLNNHRGGHTDEYHRGVQRILDQFYDRYLQSGTLTPENARNFLNQAIEEIWKSIQNGTLRPYRSKDVWL